MDLHVRDTRNRQGTLGAKGAKKSIGRINEGLACSETLNMVTKTTPDEIDR